jgi:hypothetical protein
MKDDEGIETMYSRFRTLVFGLQILKKSYVAYDHVNKILRSILAIEEAKDLNTLSVENLISSLKCHEIGLNKQEPIRRPKPISLKSTGKSSKAVKENESEDESPAGDSDEDPDVIGEMAMLSNRLQYLERKNKKLLGRGSG